MYTWDFSELTLKDFFMIRQAYINHNYSICNYIHLMELLKLCDDYSSYYLEYIPALDSLKYSNACCDAVKKLIETTNKNAE